MRFVNVYQLSLEDPRIEAGVGARILKIKISSGQLFVYCEIDTRDKKKIFEFKIVKTSEPLNDREYEYEYIDTVFDDSYNEVKNYDCYHIYRKIR